MPAVPRSNSAKRGAPKAKGAVRAKSGCYTCRIRRKKCDEQADDTGRCSTCVRLRLECLGFGAKRPEWLRENSNVTELREKIKVFLAAQGMIKGHSGSGSRSAEHEPSMLRLNEDYSSSSESPPTPTLSLTSDPVRHHHNTSAMRDEGWGINHGISGYGQTDVYPTTLLRPDSPYSQGSVHDQSYLTTVDSSNSLVPSPAIHSSFSPLYNQPLPFEDYFYPPLEQFEGNPTAYLPPNFIDWMVKHYMRNVVEIQYLFADKGVPAIIFETVSSHTHSRIAVSVLASVHHQRFLHPDRPVLDTIESRQRLDELSSLFSLTNALPEDAMAALHIVSSILFDGGQGHNWHKWLKVACIYVDNLFARYRGPEDALLHCSPKDAFIIKTAIWFDVLASVTTQENPHFRNAIREMFSPSRSSVLDPSIGVPAQYSMLSPMGCDNTIVWALAEISSLVQWKQTQINQGSLSIPVLVSHAAEIEQYLQPDAYRAYADYPNGDFHGRRRLASDIFRSAARLYLRTVVSGNYRHVKEIKDSIQDIIQCIQRVKIVPDDMTDDNHQPAARSIVRNTVFAFFLCGALASTNHARRIVLESLEREVEGTGNSASLVKLLNELWYVSDLDPKAPVEWPQLLKKTMTLLV